VARRGRPTERSGWAAQVFQHIPTADEDRWVSGVELQRLTGLKYMQVIYGIQYLKDNFPEFPLVSMPKRGYRFSLDGRDVRAHGQWRMKTAYTVVRHAYRGAIAPYLQHLQKSDGPLVPVVRRQFERALEDLGDLIAATP
jgi:hypothetical protein